VIDAVSLRTAAIDARNYILVGDPAARAKTTDGIS
jgi:hypothetical protein